MEQQTKTAMIQKVMFCLLQEELKKLRLRVEELIRENQRLHAESARMSEHSQEDRWEGQTNDPNFIYKALSDNNSCVEKKNTRQNRRKRNKM